MERTYANCVRNREQQEWDSGKAECSSLPQDENQRPSMLAQSHDVEHNQPGIELPVASQRATRVQLPGSFRGLVALPGGFWGLPAAQNHQDRPAKSSELEHGTSSVQHQEDAAQDESTQSPDIEPLLPVPRNLLGHSWVPRYSLRLELGTSGYSYEGDTAESQMHGVGRLNMGDEQFIVGVWDMNLLSELRMCQLTIPSGNEKTRATASIVRRKSDYLLTVSEDDLYIAIVTLTSSTRELDFTATPEKLRKRIFNQISVQKVIADESKDKRQEALETLEEILKHMVRKGESIQRASNFFILRRLSKYELNSNTIKKCKDVPNNVKEAFAEFFDRENRYLKNVSLFLKEEEGDHRVDLQKIMSKIYNDEIRAHRMMLISKCPKALPRLKNTIENRLDDYRILFVTEEDVDGFNSIANLQCFEPYKTFFNGVVGNFEAFINQDIGDEINPSSVLPIMSPVYVFLVKSFWEVVQKIKDNAVGFHPGDMLKWKDGRGKLNIGDDWTTDEPWKISFFGQCQIIFDMMEYCSPGYRVLSKGRPKYIFKVLQLLPTSGFSALKKLPIERLVWFYIFDHTLHCIFKGKYNKVEVQHLMPFKPLFRRLVSAIKDEQEDRHETFRMLVLNMLEYITLTLPFFSRYSSTFCEIIAADIEKLFFRVNEIFGYGWEGPCIVSDLIIESNRYFSMRDYIFSGDATGYLGDHISRMKHKLQNIFFTSMVKNVSPEIWMDFFRSLNDFVHDFKALDFCSNWYVKSDFMDMANNTHLKKIENKLTGTNCTYLVTDVEKYVDDLTSLRSRNPPHHYIILVVTRLLECIETCLSKQWLSAGTDLDTAQIESTTVLLGAVARSFMNLDDQRECVDFEVFEKESTSPFVHLVDNYSDVDEFKSRCDTVRECFWFIRKTDAIDINSALTSFERDNGHKPEELLDPYKLYKEHFDRYINQYLPTLSSNNGTLKALIMKEIRQTNVGHFSKWSETTKTQNIPILLAGVSAVWSFLNSKDLFGSGKMLKPHCVQILCIMRLLSLDLSNGAANHLAQVMTGQGKSVILGLLSAVLALTGHKVKVLCYSNYLTTRDGKDFEEFYRFLGIDGRVSYNTFEGMANGFLNPICDGSPTKLRQLIKDRVLHGKWPALGSVTTESNDTVLLIDEVDVFFTDRFYGNSYVSCTTLKLDGLELVQEEIWRLATAGHRQQEKEIFRETKAFIERNSLLESFLKNPNVLPLLETNDSDASGIIWVKEYTRSSLLDKHLRDMVNAAVSVANSDEDNINYRANFKFLNGRISAKRNDEIYSEKWYVGYLNTFNYFVLKGSDYDHQNGQNYGYLCLRTGQISYALLPSQFKHILGVSGTLKKEYLNEYEESAIKSYGIERRSYLPSFYRDSNLKVHTFKCFKKEQTWLREIHEGASRQVQNNRAVLIFFETDWAMEHFTKEYRNKYDRFNQITLNTDEVTRDKYIGESGRLRAVTLATRGMGRGVDYKSSMVVEANGGVHVIQTFFSEDIKEEIQIQGRTARQDNKGSYELIVCKEHLFKNDEFLKLPYYDLSPDYAGLNRSREALWMEKSKRMENEISECKRNHTVTMKYYGFT